MTTNQALTLKPGDMVFWKTIGQTYKVRGLRRSKPLFSNKHEWRIAVSSSMPYTLLLIPEYVDKVE